MVFFFSVTTPFGIALGIALSKTYKENSPTSLISVGLLNASSAGLLIYMALVDLLSADFMGPKLQGSIKLQIKSFVAVLLGAGGMSVMAKWAWSSALRSCHCNLQKRVLMSCYVPILSITSLVNFLHIFLSFAHYLAWSSPARALMCCHVILCIWRHQKSFPRILAG